VPTSSVSAARRFALDGVARKVEIPEAGVIAPNEPELLIWMSPFDPAADAPDGVAHVPSPRQNVDDDADVPAFR
jgi:hypothetical protein